MVIGQALSAPAGRLTLRSETLGGLPIVCRFLARMRVGALLERYLPETDARVGLPAASPIRPFFAPPSRRRFYAVERFDP